MTKRDLLVGLGVGLSFGYVAVRAFEASHELRAPAPVKPKDAASYGRQRRLYAVAGMLRGFPISASFAFGGGAGFIAKLTRPPKHTWLHPAVFVATTMAVTTAVELPVDFFEDYALERRYGLTHQPLHGWLIDRAKETALGTFFAALIVTGFAALARRLPRLWPFVASLCGFGLFALVNLVVPVYVMPLFNRFEPLRGPLERRLRELAKPFGVEDARIMRMDMSRRTTKANAFVTGIGNTHRIVIGDTLLEHFPDDEIAFVVAHELGHYVSKDSWRIIGLGGTLTTVILFGSELLLPPGRRARVHEPETLIQFYFWMTLVSAALRPALLAFMRSREWSADRFALEATHAPAIGAQAFRRLRDQNLSEDEQPPWFDFLFASHPSLKKRIAALESAARLRHDR